ncbi:hypothetical protein BC830DRAFT_1082668 [Chytriomyces sp. MP71]|nr:hypothetical protein BC830DRAFT_1082668 [Chytriomyces sp. MP71]
MSRRGFLISIAACASTVINAVQLKNGGVGHRNYHIAEAVFQANVNCTETMMIAPGTTCNDIAGMTQPQMSLAALQAINPSVPCGDGKAPLPSNITLACTKLNLCLDNAHLDTTGSCVCNSGFSLVGFACEPDNALFTGSVATATATVTATATAQAVSTKANITTSSTSTVTFVSSLATTTTTPADSISSIATTTTEMVSTAARMTSDSSYSSVATTSTEAVEATTSEKVQSKAATTTEPQPSPKNIITTSEQQPSPKVITTQAAPPKTTTQAPPPPQHNSGGSCSWYLDQVDANINGHVYSGNENGGYTSLKQYVCNADVGPRCGLDQSNADWAGDWTYDWNAGGGGPNPYNVIWFMQLIGDSDDLFHECDGGATFDLSQPLNLQANCITLGKWCRAWQGTARAGGSITIDGQAYSVEGAYSLLSSGRNKIDWVNENPGMSYLRSGVSVSEQQNIANQFFNNGGNCITDQHYCAECNGDYNHCSASQGCMRYRVDGGYFCP